MFYHFKIVLMLIGGIYGLCTANIARKDKFNEDLMLSYDYLLENNLLFLTIIGLPMWALKACFGLMYQ